MRFVEKIQKPVSILLISALVTTTSCTKKFDNATDSESSVPVVTYAGTTLNSQAGADGKLSLRSSIASRNETFDVTLQVSVKDESGKAVSGARVLYTQINEKMILHVSDPSGRLVPALFVGTPRDFEKYFGGSSSQGKVPPPEGQALAKTNFIPLLIGVIIILASVTYAEIQVIKHAYRINKFYLTDYVEEGNDYVMYCKSFQEIAELIKSRFGIVTGLTSVFVSFMGAGASSSSTGAEVALQFTEEVASTGADEIRDGLLDEAIDRWGVAMNDLVGRKVAVRIYPYDTHAAFSNVQNMLFAVLQIDYKDTRCLVQGNAISGSVSEAVTGTSLGGVLVQLAGTASRSTVTDGAGSYSFPSLSAGSYTVTASRSGYITDTKSVTLSGTPVVANFVLSTSLPSGQYRVVLQWGSAPSDLDAHLTGPLTAGGRFHMYWYYAVQYGHTNPWPGIVTIDRDDTTGNGFETITLYQQNAGTHRYSVHDYTNRSKTSSYALSGSGAQVSVYKGSSMLQRFNVPTNSGGTVWTVFELTGSAISPVNSMSYQSDPTSITKPWVPEKHP